MALALLAIGPAGFAPSAFRPPTARPRVTTVPNIRAAIDAHLLELPVSLLAAADEIASSAPTYHGAFGEGISVIFVIAVAAALSKNLLKDDQSSDSTSATDYAPTTVQPGWLTCDMRVPLPDYKDLENACHLLNTINGERWWLCAEQGAYANCAPSKDFSDYYKKPVFVCQAE